MNPFFKSRMRILEFLCLWLLCLQVFFSLFSIYKATIVIDMHITFQFTHTPWLWWSQNGHTAPALTHSQILCLSLIEIETWDWESESETFESLRLWFATGTCIFCSNSPYYRCRTKGGKFKFLTSKTRITPNDVQSGAALWMRVVHLTKRSPYHGNRNGLSMKVCTFHTYIR